MDGFNPPKGQWLQWVCALRRGHSPVGASPPGESLQPEATGAANAARDRNSPAIAPRMNPKSSAPSRPARPSAPSPSAPKLVAAVLRALGITELDPPTPPQPAETLM